MPAERCGLAGPGSGGPGSLASPTPSACELRPTGSSRSRCCAYAVLLIEQTTPPPKLGEHNGNVFACHHTLYPGLPAAFTPKNCHSLLLCAYLGVHCDTLMSLFCFLAYILDLYLLVCFLENTPSRLNTLAAVEVMPGPGSFPKAPHRWVSGIPSRSLAVSTSNTRVWTEMATPMHMI